MRNTYWHKRMEKWGMWREGVRGIQVSPLVRAMSGVPRSTSEENLPRDFSEEIETHELVAHLSTEQRKFAALIYPGKARIVEELGITKDVFQKRTNALHSTLARMLDQRRRGEELNPTKPRARLHVQRMKLGGKTAAAVAK